MSNPPQYPGSPERGPEERPRHSPGQPQGPRHGSPAGPPAGPPSGPPPGPPQGPPPRRPPGPPPVPPPPYGPPQPGPGQPGPYGAPPQQPNPYGAPPPGPYGAPPQAANPFPPRSQPVWQGHQAPQQGWHGGPPQGTPPGRKSKKIWLIPLLLVLLLAVAAGGVLGVRALTGDESETVAVSDIEAGDCLLSPDLGEGSAKVDDLERVRCDEDHHAEVFAVLEFVEVQDEDLDGAGTRCVGAAEEKDRTLSDLESDDLEIRPLVASTPPKDGDRVVCFIRHQDGQELSDAEFE